MIWAHQRFSDSLCLKFSVELPRIQEVLEMLFLLMLTNMAKIQICLLQAPEGQTGRNGAMNKPRNVGLEDVQSNLSLTRVITAKLQLHVFSGYRGNTFHPKHPD